LSNILKQYRVAGEDKNVRVINSNSMIKQFFADSISHPADSYTGISSDAQSSLEKTKSLSPDTQESGFNDGINAAVVTEIDVSARRSANQIFTKDSPTTLACIRYCCNPIKQRQCQ